MNMNMDYFILQAKNFLTAVIFKNIPKLILALVVLWIGWKLINWFNRFLDRFYERKNIDLSLRNFLRSIFNIVLRILLVLTVMDMVGIEATSFIAMLGAAGLAIGMALQGTLQNFAGGIIILVLKPYKVGDYIEQGEYKGSVVNIQIFNTILQTLDNKKVIIPNTELATKALVNYSQMEYRRGEIAVSIAYGESIEKARQVILDFAENCPKISHEAQYQPSVVVTALGESAVELAFRFYTKPADHLDTVYYMNQAIYEQFNQNGIEIPFNQLDIHVSKE